MSSISELTQISVFYWSRSVFKVAAFFAQGLKDSQVATNSLRV